MPSYQTYLKSFYETSFFFIFIIQTSRIPYHMEVVTRIVPKRLSAASLQHTMHLPLALHSADHI